MFFSKKFIINLSLRCSVLVDLIYTSHCHYLFYAARIPRLSFTSHHNVCHYLNNYLTDKLW